LFFSNPFLSACYRLQDEYAALQKELKSTIEDSRLVQEKYTKLVTDARSQLTAKIAENEQLKTQVGGSVAEWLACRTQAQKSTGSNRSRGAIE